MPRCLLAMLTVAALADCARAQDRPVVLNPVGHPPGLLRPLITPDGKTVLTAGQGRVRGWDAETGQPLFVIWLPPGDPLPNDNFHTRYRISPGSRLLAVPYATAKDRYAVCLIDLTERKTYRMIADQNAKIVDIAFSPDSKKLAVAGYGRFLVRVFDVASGEVAWQSDEYQDWSPTIVCCTPDVKRVTASAVRSDPWESALRTWDLTTGKLVHELPSSRNLRWSPAGDYLYLEWGGSPPLRLYDAEGRVKWSVGTDVYNHPHYVGFTPAGEPVMAWRTTGK